MNEMSANLLQNYYQWWYLRPSGECAPVPVITRHQTGHHTEFFLWSFTLVKLLLWWSVVGLLARVERVEDLDDDDDDTLSRKSVNARVASDLR